MQRQTDQTCQGSTEPMVSKLLRPVEARHIEWMRNTAAQTGKDPYPLQPKERDLIVYLRESHYTIIYTCLRDILKSQHWKNEELDLGEFPMPVYHLSNIVDHLRVIVADEDLEIALEV